MAELVKKIYIKKDGNAVAHKIYSTAAEAGANYIRATVDGVNGYIPICAVGGVNSSAGRVQKNGTTYALATSGKPPYTEKSWTTPGTYTFTVPKGVTKIRVTMSGGGGAGGGYLTGVMKRGGGGGGAGGYIKNYVMNVDSNSTIAIVVGAGGMSPSDSISPASATASKVGSIFANGGGNGNHGGDGGIGGTTTLGDSGANGENRVGPNGGNGGTSGDGTPGGVGGIYGGDYGKDGSRGSGGGGAGVDGWAGNGGDGFVTIEFGGDI